MENTIKYFVVLILIFLSNNIFSQKLIPYRHGNKWGFSDKKGKVVIKPRYKSVGFFFSNLKVKPAIACVKKGKKYIFINKKGKKIIKGNFDKASSFNPYTSYARVTKNGEDYCMDKNGDKTRCFFYCSGSESVETHFFRYSENGKIGIYHLKSIVTSQGKDSIKREKLPAIWDSFQENYYGYAIVEKDKKFGIINNKFELIVTYKYDTILTTRTNNRESGQFKILENGKWGLLERNGKMLIEPIYYKIDFFSRYVTKAWVDKSFWFYIDKKGFEFYSKR